MSYFQGFEVYQYWYRSRVFYSLNEILFTFRISCSETNAKGQQNIVLNVNSTSSMKDNIIQVFGDKEAKSLVPILWKEKMSLTEDEVRQSNLSQRQDQSVFPKFGISGFVSSCEHGKVTIAFIHILWQY